MMRTLPVVVGGGNPGTDFSGTWIYASPSGAWKTEITGNNGTQSTTINGVIWEPFSTFTIEWTGSTYVTSTSYPISLNNDVLTIGNLSYNRSAADPGTDFSGTWVSESATPKYKFIITNRSADFYGAAYSSEYTKTSTNNITWTGGNFLLSNSPGVISLSNNKIYYVSREFTKQ